MGSEFESARFNSMGPSSCTVHLLATHHVVSRYTQQHSITMIVSFVQ